MTPCRGGCGVLVAGTRCRSCADAYNARARRRKGRAAHHVPPSHLFKGFSRAATISRCPFSYWATPEAQQDPALFYAIARARAAETKGRERIAP